VALLVMVALVDVVVGALRIERAVLVEALARALGRERAAVAGVLEATLREAGVAVGLGAVARDQTGDLARRLIAAAARVPVDLAVGEVVAVERAFLERPRRLLGVIRGQARMWTAQRD